jgi:zinc D-Ala-D-Ala carboxypeptidase
MTIEVDGKVYQISYYDYTRNLTIPIPADGEYELSGDNRGGIILMTY